MLIGSVMFIPANIENLLVRVGKRKETVPMRHTEKKNTLTKKLEFI